MRGEDAPQGDSPLIQGPTLTPSSLPYLSVPCPYSRSFPILCFVLWKVAEGHSGSETGLCGATFETTFPSR